LESKPGSNVAVLQTELDIAVAAVEPAARDPPPIAAFREAFLRIGLGFENIRDYWSSYAPATCSCNRGNSRTAADIATSTSRSASTSRHRGRACTDDQPQSTVEVVDDPHAGLAVSEAIRP
jgi:hypothetical protein